MPTGWAPPTRAMVAEGASVMIGDILADQGHALVDEIGDRAAFVGLDVTDPDQWAAAVSATADRLGAVTVLVNNAGIQEAGLIGSYPLESWHRALDINLTGTFLGCRAVADPMITAGVGGAIVNNSDQSAKQRL